MKTLIKELGTFLKMGFVNRREKPKEKLYLWERS